MYLKNTSDSAAIIINTVVGKVGIRPGEIVDIRHKILPIVSRNIIQVTEEEYLSFRQGKHQINEQNKSTNRKPDPKPDKEVTEEVEETELSNYIDKILDIETKEEEEEDNTPKIDFESKGEETNAEPLKVNEELNTNDELTSLKNQIDELKEQWKEANAHDKDKLQKQIKELQKQVKKLEKLSK